MEEDPVINYMLNVFELEYIPEGDVKSLFLDLITLLYEFSNDIRFEIWIKQYCQIEVVNLNSPHDKIQYAYSKFKQLQNNFKLASIIYNLI